MAGDGEHQVVVAVVHKLDVGAQRRPELAQALKCVGIGLVVAVLRREDYPTVLEEFGKAGVRA